MVAIKTAVFIGDESDSDFKHGFEYTIKIIHFHKSTINIIEKHNAFCKSYKTIIDFLYDWSDIKN